MTVYGFVSSKQVIVLPGGVDCSQLSPQEVGVLVELGDALVAAFAKPLEPISKRLVRWFDGNAFAHFLKEDGF